MRRLLIVLLLLAPVTLPRAQTTADELLRFAVIGDNGTGDELQYALGRQMAASRETFPFELVLMLGDNLYRRASPEAYSVAFERPYERLLSQGVKFVAVLGNHDSPESVRYPGWNMNGQRYFTFARGPVRFFALDTTAMDNAQLAWLDRALAESKEPWQVAYFHHPIYSNGKRHGSNVELRVRLEPIFVRHGVEVVFAGHDHFYERLKPQKGITYFVSGAGGKLRKDGVDPSDTSAAVFDDDLSFMLIEVDADAMRFRSLSRAGAVVDSGTIPRRPSS